jgi:hypothetical protein
MAGPFQSSGWGELIYNKPLAAALGLGSHYVLNNGEWDHSFHLIFAALPFVFVLLTTIVYLVNPQTHSIATALQATSAATGVYLSTLVASILIYRTFFHRLRKVIPLAALHAVS